MHPYDIVRALRATPSRLAKEKILKDNVDNEDFWHVAKFAYDSLLNYHIAFPTRNDVGGLTFTLNHAFGLLMELDARAITGNEARERLANLCGGLSEDDFQLVKLILDRDLACGIDAKTLNKVKPGHIFTWPIMLATEDGEKNREKIKFPAYVELKSDGMRFNAVVRQELGRFLPTVNYFTRRGKIMKVESPDLDNAFIDLMQKHDSTHMVFDGEMQVVGHDGQFLSRQSGNGILSKAQKLTINQQEADQIVATLWDAIPGADWLDGLCKVTYRERSSTLASFVSGLPTTRVRFIKRELVSDWEAATKFASDRIVEGLEGAIVKNVDGVWEDRRSRDLVKIKAEYDAEFKIVGWEEGTGKNAGRLGALVIESFDGTIRCNVGIFKGFDEDEIRNLKAEDVVGKTATVLYNAVIKDKNKDVMCLFLPRVIEIDRQG